MEKIFDIAKDSEKSWGTLATAIDGNFEEVEGAIYESGKMDETIDLVTPGEYKKVYFGKVYASGTILKSMQTQSVVSFYLVNADDTTDTANGLINASKLPYTIPNNIKGIASIVSGDISLTFEVSDAKLNRIDLLEKKCSDELERIKPLYGKKNRSVWRLHYACEINIRRQNDSAIYIGNNRRRSCKFQHWWCNVKTKSYTIGTSYNRRGGNELYRCNYYGESIC